MMTFEEIMAEANRLYAISKLKDQGLSDLAIEEAFAYKAPEQLPHIKSKQITAFAQAIVDAVNKEET